MVSTCISLSPSFTHTLISASVKQVSTEFITHINAFDIVTGAHCLGKNHQRDTRWVDDGTKFNNQYYKDMLASAREWKRGNG